MTYRRKDSYYRRARAAGYRARSAYKLAELDARFRLLRAGDYVVDLGAWPGGWLQVALERVGSRGRVVGVDTVPLDPLPAPNLELVVGDVRDRGTAEAALSGLGRRADVILSDLSPRLSGVRDTDEARAAELIAAALGTLPTLLRPGGHLLLKMFMNSRYGELIDTLTELFAEVRTTRPEATRQGSAELYAIAKGHRPRDAV